MALTPGKLYFITMDEAPVTHLQQVETACEAGIRCIQLRMKNAGSEEYCKTAIEAKEICDQYDCRLIVNDHVEVARTIGAYGVHIGKEDMPVAEARKMLGAGYIIGATANTIEDIRQHVRDGADYIGLGPYRFTTTKKQLSPVLGLEGYQRILMQMRSEGLVLPVVAIGGIGMKDIGPLTEAGIYGVAFSGMLVHTENKRERVAQLETLFKPDERMLKISGQSFTSRLFTGTGKFGSAAIMEESILASGSQLVTVALKRVDTRRQEHDDLLLHLRHPHIRLLPNTSGVRTAKEAIFAAELAREALQTSWLKLEIHPDPRWLMPDPVETLLAAEALVKKGFIVLPYIHADPVLCRRLEDVGVAAVMPLGAPIGSNKGLKTADFLEIIIAQSRVPVVVDAGIGAPSDAALAMEMGADAVLVNTAIAASADPVKMGVAFKLAVESGRMGHEAKLARSLSSVAAVATSPLTAFLDE